MLASPSWRVRPRPVDLLAGFVLLCLGAAVLLAFACPPSAPQPIPPPSRAAAAAELGDAYDAIAQAKAEDVARDEAQVARLKAQLATLRQRLDAKDGGERERLAVVQGDHAAGDSALLVADLRAFISKQDETLKAQDRVIGDLKVQLDAVTKARDTWKLSAQAAAAEALQLRGALAAREGVERGALWRGRIQGLAVGLGAGYVGGRLR